MCKKSHYEILKKAIKRKHFTFKVTAIDLLSSSEDYSAFSGLKLIPSQAQLWGIVSAFIFITTETEIELMY